MQTYFTAILYVIIRNSLIFLDCLIFVSIYNFFNLFLQKDYLIFYKSFFLIKLVILLLQALSADPEDVITGRAMGRSVLITCCDTALGLQLAMHLSNVGFRVFAGLRSGVAAPGEQRAADSAESSGERGAASCTIHKTILSTIRL